MAGFLGVVVAWTGVSIFQPFLLYYFYFEGHLCFVHHLVDTGPEALVGEGG